MGVKGSAAPVTRMAPYTYARPDKGSRIAPPIHVAAPPNGSISVGWLWVSFLNSNSQSSSCPFTVTFIFTVQALISSDSSNLSSFPCCLRYFPARVAISMKLMGLVLPNALRVSK